MAMLFVGRTQVSKEEICKKFGVDLAKILKHPSFEVSKHRKKIDRVNGGVVKTGVGMGSRSHFIATDPATSMKVEIRYAQSHVPKQVGDSMMDVFEPRYVQFMGGKKAFQNDPELAIYWFLHPNNSLSPLRDPKNKNKPKIEYIDNKKRAQDKNESIDALTDALSHAKTLPYAELVVLAKGLGLKGIHGKEEDDVRATVREYASRYPKIYNEKALTRITSYEGKIIHMIDLGVIKMSTIGSVRRWTWAQGPKEGEVIVDIQNATQDAKVALKNYIFEHIQEYAYLLDNIHEGVSAREKAEAFLSQPVSSEEISANIQIGDALPDHLRTINQETVTTMPLSKVKVFADAVEYLTSRDGKRPSPTVASQFLKDVLSGAVKE